MVRAVDRIRLKPVIDARYSFAELPKAMAHLRRGAFGKVVVHVRDSGTAAA
jgi:NADPH:quinone reductase-like Zn-dependent oxidoreductase